MPTSRSLAPSRRTGAWRSLAAGVAAGVAAALAACADAPTRPAAEAVPLGAHGPMHACAIDSDGCILTSLTVDIASVAIDSGSFTSTAGERFFASRATSFHLVPPNPVVPPNPILPTLDAWNTLVGSDANYRAYLGLLRNVPPNPIAPGVSIHFAVGALYDGASYYLTDVTPVVVGP